jgi:hypothetical protein
MHYQLKRKEIMDNRKEIMDNRKEIMDNPRGDY